MKVSLLKPRIQAFYLCGGLLALVVYLLPDVSGLAQAADTTIAFMSNRSNERNGEIYLMSSDGKRLRRLTKHPQYDAVPTWSPDGQKITFVSFRDEHRFQGGGMILAEIYMMNPDGTNPINLTQSPKRADGGSSWSPDGKQIAFTAGERFKHHAGYRWNIWVMDVDGGNPRKLTNHTAGDGNPDWSPDGRHIAFHSERNRDWEFDIKRKNLEIYVMNTDGTNFINLTNHPAEDRQPDWSPDGLQIAFSSNRDGNLDIYVMNADGTNPINLTNHPAVDKGPAWSPDGRQIAFHSERDRKDKDDKNVEIYVMNANGTNPINLTNHPAIDRGPSWEPAPTLNVSSKGKLVTLWGKVKRVNTYGAR